MYILDMDGNNAVRDIKRNSKMAHMLEFRSGRAAMAYTGQLPWHGLGTKVADDLTPMQMCEAAQLDWKVRKCPIAIDFNADGNYRKVEGTRDQALVRETDRKLMDVVSREWKPTQNEEAFAFFNEFCESGKMKMHTAGSIRGGRMVWALAKLEEAFELDGGDKTEGYLLFSNPHEFGQSITVQFTPIRVVCNNTLTLALQSEAKHRVAINHRKGYNEQEVKEMLGISADVMRRYKEAAEHLSSKRYTPEDAETFMRRIFPLTADEKKRSAYEEETRYANGKKPLSRNAKDALGIIETQPGAEFFPESYWNLFNAVTFMTDHVIGRGVDTRIASAWYGTNRTKKVKALELAQEMADAAV